MPVENESSVSVWQSSRLSLFFGRRKHYCSSGFRVFTLWLSNWKFLENYFLKLNLYEIIFFFLTRHFAWALTEFCSLHWTVGLFSIYNCCINERYIFYFENMYEQSMPKKVSVERKTNKYLTAQIWLYHYINKVSY